MEGIKETKEALECICALANAFDKALSDGQMTLTDAMEFLPVLVQLPAALSGISDVKREAADYSPEEIQALSALVKARLDLRNDAVEQGIEYAIEVVLNLAKLLASMKA